MSKAKRIFISILSAIGVYLLGLLVISSVMGEFGDTAQAITLFVGPIAIIAWIVYKVN